MSGDQFVPMTDQIVGGVTSSKPKDQETNTKRDRVGGEESKGESGDGDITSL
jgi:hypothetical protein